MTRRTAVVLMALIAGGAVGVGWLVFLPRMPLDGPRTHDFGEVRIPSVSSQVVQTLEYRNTSTKVVQIGGVMPTCSCVSARVDRKTIEPGGMMQLHLGMKLVDSARKDVTVNLAIEGHGVLSVALTARGRREQQISAGQREVMLARGESFVTTVNGEVWAADKPDVPVVETLIGLQVTIDEWSERKPANEAESRPAVFSGRLTIRADEDAAAGQHELRLMGLGTAPCTIRVTIK